MQEQVFSVTGGQAREAIGVYERFFNIYLGYI